MNHKFLNSQPRCGTTLIEVLAGLVILGTLLASLAMARGRFIRQWAEAEQRINAAHEIDQLLEVWLSGPQQTLPIARQGVTDDVAHHVWRTRIIENSSARSLGSIVVRLQIYARQSDDVPLASVDFLLGDVRGKIK